MDKPPWVEIAEKEIGVDEQDKRVLDYFKATNYENPTVGTAYCSAFLNWCFDKAGIKGTRNAAAVSWRNWGKELNQGQLGAVVLFEWAKGGHHVALYEDEGEHNGQYKIKVLGGNQTGAHEVCEEWVPFTDNDVLTFRWPAE